MGADDKYIHDLGDGSPVQAADLILIDRNLGTIESPIWDNFKIPAFNVSMPFQTTANFVANTPLVIQHNLNTFPVFVTVWASDGQGNIVEQEVVKLRNATDANNYINLLSNSSITGAIIKVRS